MITSTNILLLIFAYLLGSIPFSVIAGKLLKGIDIREYGSGNAGATNVFRVLGKKAGLPVLILDILKGYLAVNLVYFSDFNEDPNMYVNLSLSFGVIAVIGHILPIFLAFRGGKGVATLLGLMIGVFPYAAIFSILIFLFVLIISKYVSLSSIIASLFFPIGVYLFFNNLIPTVIIFSLFVPIIIIVTHQRNIERIFKGEESKVKIFKK